MFNLKRLKDYVLQNIISFEGAISGPTRNWLQPKCLKVMGVKLEGPVFIGQNVVFSNPQRLVLGKRVAIANMSHIACHKEY